MRRILVVDDEKMNLGSTKYMLENAGYEVMIANSGESGLALLQEISFDLLLLDVEMPGMNGIDTLKELRAIPELDGLKVCFLTASSSQEDLAEAIHLGASGFIKKPCTSNELIQAIEDALDEKNNVLMLVVDDEPLNQKMMMKIFGAAYHVECVSSGQAALDFVAQYIPDIIVMDLHMPEMDGRETFARVRRMENGAGVPVVFLTADDDEDTELELFRAGAMDFIHKPFLGEIVKERIRRILELKRLQNVLQDEVDRKTVALTNINRKIQKLSEQIIYALSGAIDAKDTYTNGHSNRVAEYSREIAIRMGKNAEEVNDIYFAAMLHDVGKIGVPNEIINKPGRLTQEEFDIIKGHTTKGARILETISELPSLSVGAHWHHERYDGKGYPDGLSGEDIPETARIICVADCYDAMTSNRSYRKALPQQIVRSEIENGAGTQFDPRIARIMLEMMDEDPKYEMRETWSNQIPRSKLQGCPSRHSPN